MLNIIRVEEDSRSIILHPVESTRRNPFNTRSVYCRLELEYQYDSSGRRLPGRCSRICEHGVMAATDSFKLKFPMLIEGGLSP